MSVSLLSCSSEPAKSADIQENSNSLPYDNIAGHPFLIVTKDLYPALREKANSEPWQSLKKDAISRANTNSYIIEYVFITKIYWCCGTGLYS